MDKERRVFLRDYHEPHTFKNLYFSRLGVQDARCGHWKMGLEKIRSQKAPPHLKCCTLGFFLASALPWPCLETMLWSWGFFFRIFPFFSMYRWNNNNKQIICSTYCSPQTCMNLFFSYHSKQTLFHTATLWKKIDLREGK